MTEAEKKFGLTIEEIREMKSWCVKQQDFEAAVMWREMEREIVPAPVTKTEIESTSGDNVIEFKVTVVLPEGWKTSKL